MAQIQAGRADTRRVQFEFSQDAIDRLNRMKGETDASSYAEVVRDALRIYEWVLEQERAGYEIGLVKDDVLTKTVKFML